MDEWTSFMGRSGFLPHGFCLSWSPGLLWSMVGSDLLIAASYFSIPMAMLSFTRRRADSSLKGVMWLFSAFIFACGITHVMEVWTLWRPDYVIQVLTKGATAAISMVTAVFLWRLIPQALKIPSQSSLRSAIQELEAEVARRRTAEETLVEVQQGLSVTLSSFGAGFIATDRAGRVLRMNDTAESLLAWPVAEALGRPLHEVFLREDRSDGSSHRNPVDLALELEADVGVAHHLIVLSRDGTRIPVEVKVAVTRTPEGQPSGIALVFRDQSRLLRAEAESKRLAAIVESSNDAIIGKALDGRITSWNGAAQAMFGYSAAEAIGQPVQMLMPPERVEEEMRILTELTRGHSVKAFDTVRRAKDGRLLDLSVTISPIRDEHGTIVGASKIARDVTQERRAAAALHESDLRLRFALEAAQIGDWELDLVTGAERRSLRHDRCFGYSSPQPSWSFDIFLRHVHPDDRAEAARQLEAARIAHLGWRFECRVVWPDTSVHWISSHGSTEHVGGSPRRMLGIVTDITAQRQAEEARLTAQRLEAENRQMQEANRLKNQFLANMSHELRTPLNAVIGFADLLHAGAVPTDSPKHREFLSHIATSGRHLLQLINDVLDLSKVESGTFEFFPEPVDLPVLVKEVGDTLQSSLLRKGIELQTEIAPELVGLVLDASRLKQVLYNYLSNAVKFTPEGGRIAIRARAEGPDRFRVEVEDNGIGIAADDLPRLFTDFLQLDAGYDKRHEGTGLGLALTRRLVQAQGGSVGVHSELGAGSQFHFVLDRVVHHRPVGSGRPPASPAASGSLGALAPALQAHRLLVIEDDPARQALIVGTLRAVGFEVDAAATAEQAQQKVRAEDYSAITLDMCLPDEAGLGVLARIRAQQEGGRAPVIGVSLPSRSLHGASFCIADILSKPLHVDEVATALGGLRTKDVLHKRVMVIDDDPAALALMRATLESLEIDAACWTDGREALKHIETFRPDAIVLDLLMPDFDGIAMLHALSGVQAWQRTPVFIWTSLNLSEAEYALLATSAEAILGQGGGGLQPMLEGLRRWRPQSTLELQGSLL
jgi:PAS domain S-box-containing protein